MPNGMVLSKNYEENRDLLTEMLYKRNTVEVAKRSYTYDNLSRPVTRVTQREGSNAVTDSFAYNGRSELTSATVNGCEHSYAYDNIGNRKQNSASTIPPTNNQYTGNNLNQYTQIVHWPSRTFNVYYELAGNQTKVKTDSTSWTVYYDSYNRPIRFENDSEEEAIECTYDYLGRRVSKKRTLNGSVVEHTRFIYRGFLQIAAYNVEYGTFRHFLLRDPTEPIATRPKQKQLAVI